VVFHPSFETISCKSSWYLKIEKSKEGVNGLTNLHLATITDNQLDAYKDKKAEITGTFINKKACSIYYSTNGFPKDIDPNCLCDNFFVIDNLQ
jgi:hypothetical protein